MLLLDVRLAARRLSATPAFTAVVVATLALGIGINTSVFTLARLSFRQMPVAAPETIVALRWARPAGGAWFSQAEYAYVRAHAQTLAGVTATTGSQALTLATDTPDLDSRSITVEFVSDNFFSTLGAPLAIGRAFSVDETTGRAPAAVMSYRFWMTAFASDSTIVGRSLSISGHRVSVVGVATRGFGGVALGLRTPDLWLPLAKGGVLPPAVGDWPTARSVPGLYVFGRLRSGRTLGDAHAETQVLAQDMIAADPSLDPRARILVGPRALTGQDPSLAWIEAVAPMAGAGIVLLIACANLTNVLLARGVGRQREIGIRLCLGASRIRIVRELLTESLMFGLLGGASGLLFAWWGLAASLPMWPVDPDLLRQYLAPDGRMLLYTFVLSIITATVFGLLPALRATRIDLTPTTRDQGTTFGRRLASSRLRSGLMVAQLALCTVLLLVSGSFVRALGRLQTASFGFDVPRIFTVDVKVAVNGYDVAGTEQLFRDLSERLQENTAIESVARVSRFPLNGAVMTTLGVPASGATVAQTFPGTVNAVTTRFFATLGVPLVQGRIFTEDERRSDAPVVVISERTARRLWPGTDPVGRLVRVGSAAPLAQVVGVARDARIADPTDQDSLAVYVPFEARHDAGELAVVLRASGDRPTIIAAVRDALKLSDRALLATTAPLEERIRMSEQYRVAAGASAGSAALGLLALVLAAVGLYGLIAFLVTQRTREIGVRIAVGAAARDIVRLVVGQAIRAVVLGITIGGVMGAAVARLTAARLVGVPSFDPLVYSVVTAVLAVVACGAAYFPARRAAALDPILALRHD